MPNALLQLAALALLPAAALAQDVAPTPSAPTTAPPRKLSRSDPNRMVCETVEEIGTRIGGKRVCMTAAQWKQQRADNRDALDRTQVVRGCNTAGAC